MTERGRSAVERTTTSLRIGPSSLWWQGNTFAIDVDEVGAPVPRRVRGEIRITPEAFPARSFFLDIVGRHVWQPVAPRARIEVALDRPKLRWSGTAYFDSNFGSEPLEARFKSWTWSRAHLSRDAIVLYDAQRHGGSCAALALSFGPDGAVTPLEPPPPVPLPRTGWRLARSTRADADAAVTLRRTLEDTPFYARSVLETRLCGEPAEVFHESLSLDRFRSGIVRAMLPFRMPRRFF
jgi:carotenoid 1,2-hydratase